ncbi:YdcF family protein [Microcoleus sp. FACHB-672]|uniref:YdcF family protein n=1 Tax=Microcoleus sp. FACHB-672 TaxID=2692825 RepID=UPI00168219F4|nr:YdcF family protein [Microcoleus sp. FACHB-672]MBD2042579.1 YdcF family protein [Microcoleus sp. FACHB-672]
MNPKNRGKLNQAQGYWKNLASRKVLRFILWALLLCLVALTVITGRWLYNNNIALQTAKTGPVDATLVLGGSIHREIYAAELAKLNPQMPVLISQGSRDPCTWLIFQQVKAPIQQVFLEKCAQSTFDNFYFSLPILQQWQVHKVKLITSITHLPRAKWLAQIMLGTHGIWVEFDLVYEKGIPGNRESWLKTGLDVTRGGIWAVISHFKQPQCPAVIPLTSIDMQKWNRQGFKCEVSIRRV